MMRRFNRLLVLFYVLSDAGLGIAAFALAYYLRFHGVVAQLIPPVKGVPPFRWYVYMMPFVAVLVPAAFHVQGLYRLRRSRTRLDDFATDDVTISNDLYEVILAYQHYRRPSA